MGIQMMEFQSTAHQSIAHPSSLKMQNSWYSLTLDEVEKQLGKLGKPLGSMNLDELLRNVWTAEASNLVGTDVVEGTSSSLSLQRQASLTLARALSGKTIDQVWKEIQQGQRKRFIGDNSVKVEEGEASFGEVTLEDFLVQAGLFAEASLGSSVELDSSMDPLTPQSLTQQLSLPASPYINVFPAMASSGRKRDPESIEKSIEKKLKRKIKNRESAARSRARKQAYQNELLNKVSCLEEKNRKLKKEKEFEMLFPSEEDSSQLKYQLRRTSSASF